MPSQPCRKTFVAKYQPKDLTIKQDDIRFNLTGRFCHRQSGYWIAGASRLCLLELLSHAKPTLRSLLATLSQRSHFVPSIEVAGLSCVAPGEVTMRGKDRPAWTLPQSAQFRARGGPAGHSYQDQRPPCHPACYPFGWVVDSIGLRSPPHAAENLRDALNDPNPHLQAKEKVSAAPGRECERIVR